MTKSVPLINPDDLARDLTAIDSISTEPTIVVSLVFPMRECHELKYRAKKSGKTITKYLIDSLNLSTQKPEGI